MLGAAGHTVLVSGVTLALCFFGLTFFEMDMLRSVGVSCGIAVGVVVLVTLCVTPALLLTFPRFFSTPFLAGQSPSAVDRVVDRLGGALRCAGGALKAATCPRTELSWRAYTELIMRPRVAIGVVALLTGCAVPIAVYATGFEYNVGWQWYAPPAARSVRVRVRVPCTLLVCATLWRCCVCVCVWLFVSCVC